MKIARAFGMMAMAAVAVMLSPTALADDSGWYAGFNVGQSKAKIDDPRIASSLLADGFTTTSISNDDHHLGFKVFGGYEFNRYIALETGYFDLGDSAIPRTRYRRAACAAKSSSRESISMRWAACPSAINSPCLRAPD